MTSGQRSILMSAVVLSCLMQTIDTTIAMVALPHMQGSMSATPDQISWVLTSYIVATAMTIPTSTYFTQRFGQKNILLVIIAGFSISSIFCGLSQSLTEVVIARLLQGVFGAFFMPLAQTVILDYYSLAERPKMMAVWGATSMVGPIIGPVLGGFLTETLDWRWVFYINLPLGMLAFLGVWLVPLERKPDSGTGFRWQGYIYLACSIGALQLLLDRGNLKDWFSSAEICFEAFMACLFFYLFVTHSLTSKKPFIDFRIFMDRNFAVSAAVMFVGGGLVYTILSLMSPFLETLLGYPVMMTGLLIAPRGVTFVIALIIYARYSTRSDPRLFLLGGGILSTISLWQIAQFDLNVSTSAIVWTGVVQGLGLGLFMAPIPILGFATLAKHYQGEAASLFSLIRNMGSSIGIAGITSLIARSVQTNHASIAEHIVPTNPIYRPENFPQGFGLDGMRGLALLESEVLRQASAIAYLNDFRLLTWLNGLCILSIFFLKFKKQSVPSADVQPVPHVID